MSTDKTAPTKHPVADLIRKRWSPRAFSKKPVSKEALETIIEAGCWSFSASNEQPWRYIAGHKGTPLFDQIHSCLKPGNQGWTNGAAVLMISLAQTTLDKDGTKNNWAKHDVGAANMCMALQATSMDIYVHPMAGFDREKIIETFNLPHHLEPVTCIALGYLGDASSLEEPFKTRELTPRVRKPLQEVILKME